MPRTFVHIPSLDHMLSMMVDALINENTESIQRPDFPEFAIESNRLQSFADWPKMMRQTPKQLSDAGFFYTQISDRVICFYCGGGLCKWEENDDPWEQHALWHNKCNYLHLNKGPEYITTVEEKFGKIRGETNSNNTPPSSSDEQISNNGNDNDNNLPLNTDEDQDSRSCKICFENEYNTIFLPCGHVLACAKCAISQMKCPMCRKPYTNINRIYLP